MSRARRGTGEQLCLMSTWEGGLKVVQWLQVMNVRYERKADIHFLSRFARNTIMIPSNMAPMPTTPDHGRALPSSR